MAFVWMRYTRKELIMAKIHNVQLRIIIIIVYMSRTQTI